VGPNWMAIEFPSMGIGTRSYKKRRVLTNCYFSERQLLAERDRRFVADIGESVEEVQNR